MGYVIKLIGVGILFMWLMFKAEDIIEGKYKKDKYNKYKKRGF